MEYGLERLLLKLNGIVEIKRRQLEVLSREYGILLKPWPHQDKNTKDKSQVKESEDIANGKTKSDQQSLINKEEQTEVDLVDKLLVRAQKARDLKKKLENKQSKTRETGLAEIHQPQEIQVDENHDKIEDNSLPERTIRSEIRNLILQEKIKSSENSSSDNVENNSKNNSHSKDTLLDDPHSKAASNIDSRVKNVPHARDISHSKIASHSRSASHGRTSNARGVSGTSTESRSSSHTRVLSHSEKPPHSTSARSASRGRSEATASNRNVSNPASNVKDRSVPFTAPRVPRPSSSRGKSYSAHINAPFKTDPTLRVARTSTNKSAMVRRGQPSGRPASGRGGHMKPKVSDSQSSMRTDRTKDHQSIQMPEEQTIDSRIDENIGFRIDNVPDLIKHTTSVPDPVDNSQDNIVDISERLVSGLEELSVSGTDTQTDGQTTAPPEKLFTLQQDGAKLQIPAKLRRLIASNLKLKEKIAALKVTKKVESKDARRDFIQRLEDQFHPDEDLVTQTSMVSCIQAHHRLLQLLKQLQLDNITELSSASEVLAAKTKMEYILSSCDSLQEEIDIINNGDFYADQNKACPPLCQHREAGVYLWLPDEVIGDVDMSPAAFLSYRNRSELQSYKHHIFELQYLRLQSVIMETVKKELLPLLQRTDPNSRSYIQVYRAVFAFLTSNDGHHLPGIVKDS